VIKPFAAVGGPVVIGPLASRRFASYRAAGGRRCVARRPLAFDLHSLNRVMKPLLPMSRVAAPTKAFRTLLRSSTCLLVLAAAAGCTPHAAPAPEAPSLPALVQQVEIRRTDQGVPHILAENLRAAAFALAWVQLEDHGPGIIRGINAARGRSALVEGRGRVDADARARLRHARAVETFELLQRDTRDVYTGFADGNEPLHPRAPRNAAGLGAARFHAVRRSRARHRRRAGRPNERVPPAHRAEPGRSRGTRGRL
jgi:hypothetical protein